MSKLRILGENGEKKRYVIQPNAYPPVGENGKTKKNIFGFDVLPCAWRAGKKENFCYLLYKNPCLAQTDLLLENPASSLGDLATHPLRVAGRVRIPGNLTKFYECEFSDDSLG